MRAFCFESRLMSMLRIAPRKRLAFLSTILRFARPSCVRQRSLQAKPPTLPDSNARDQFLASLVQVLADERIKTQMDPALASRVGKEITLREWINALETVMDSIKTRTGSISGSRDYLDFLKGFMEESGVEIAVMKETEGSKPRGIFERIRRTFKF